MEKINEGRANHTSFYKTIYDIYKYIIFENYEIDHIDFLGSKKFCLFPCLSACLVRSHSLYVLSYKCKCII